MPRYHIDYLVEASPPLWHAIVAHLGVGADTLPVMTMEPPSRLFYQRLYVMLDLPHIETDEVNLGRLQFGERVLDATGKVERVVLWRPKGEGRTYVLSPPS